ncbi:MAG: oligosaccharide flippase family protein [Rhizobacter sp.]|nr:oligosaccharide flippase family protein [Rhizobacter sp.]
MTESGTGTEAGATTQSQLISNSKWNLIAFSVALGCNFLLVPFVIRHIGLEAFGAAGLTLAVLAPFLLVGTVLGQATLRELARHVAAPELDKGNRVFAGAMFLCGISCVLIALPLLVFGESAVRMLSQSGSVDPNWQLGLALAVLGWAAQQFTLLLQSAVAATQRYASLAGIGAIASLANVAAVAGFVIRFPTTIGYLAGTSAGLLLSLAIWWLLVRRGLPWLFPFHAPTRRDFIALIHFGKWQGLSHFAGAVGLQMDRYVLGILAPIAVVGQYNVAMRLQEVVHMSVLKAGEVLFPHFSATSHDTVERRASFFVTVSWILNTLAACALAPLIPLSWVIVALWVDPATADGAAPMLRTLAAAGIVGAGANVYFYHAMGTGQTARLALLTVVHAVATVALTIVLIKLYGPVAAGLGFLATSALRLALVLPFTKLSFDATVSLGSLVACTLPPLFTGLVVGAAWHLIGSPPATHWAEVSGHYAVIFSSVAIASITLTSVTGSGRRLVVDCLRLAGRMLLRKQG